MELPHLQRLRQAAFLTQQELADRAGLTKASVNRLEGGRHRARISTVRRLAAALGVEPTELALGPAPPHNGHSGEATGGAEHGTDEEGER